MASFVIRPATVEDVDDILCLIVELAVFEKEPDAVKATPELLRKNLFEPHSVAHAILAVDSASGKSIGVAIYFFNFSTWTGKPGLYLEDLYVSPETRGNGAGKALFGALGAIAQEKWNTPAIDFYEKKLGATAQSEWLGMRLETEGIERLKNLVV